MLCEACGAHQATHRTMLSCWGGHVSDLHRSNVLVVGSGPIGGAEQAGDAAAQPLPRDGASQHGGWRHWRPTDLCGCDSSGKGVTSSLSEKVIILLNSVLRSPSPRGAGRNTLPVQQHALAAPLPSPELCNRLRTHLHSSRPGSPPWRRWHRQTWSARSTR